MRRNAIVAGILGLFLASLFAASLAEARAGGGFSGGSRGSRSYSAPRSPSPAQPSSPAAPTGPQQNLTRTPAPAAPGGFLRGWGGMIGGFLLGGLLGSLLFGGLGHGAGIGLLDILLVAGLAFAAFALFRRRQPEPALAGVPTGAGWAPADPVAPAGAPTAAEQPEPDLDSGVAAIRMMDAGFDPARFAGAAREAFVRVQAAWSAGDLAPVRAELTEEMATALERDLDRLRTLRRTNRIEQVAVLDAVVTEGWQEYGRDFVTVRLAAMALDYTTDETTGAIVDGSKSAPTRFDEYWTFSRPVGPNPWRLSAIQQPSA